MPGVLGYDVPHLEIHGYVKRSVSMVVRSSHVHACGNGQSEDLRIVCQADVARNGEASPRINLPELRSDILASYAQTASC